MSEAAFKIALVLTGAAIWRAVDPSYSYPQALLVCALGFAIGVLIARAMK
jgi:hypothetical protein